jgi:hypothetical protein
VLIHWFTEMIVGARGSAAKRNVELHKAAVRAAGETSPPH